MGVYFDYIQDGRHEYLMGADANSDTHSPSESVVDTTEQTSESRKNLAVKSPEPEGDGIDPTRKPIP